MTRITRAFFERNADIVAKELLGAVLLVNGVGGAIVETESYDSDDPASHSYKLKRTTRNAVMLGPPARAYIYRSYGIHWCLNFVCEVGSAVLIRAIRPDQGIRAMQRRRGVTEPRLLCSGPGRLCQALDITGGMNGASLFRRPFALKMAQSAAAIQIGPRIGITKAAELNRRFGLKECEYLSRRF